MLILIFIKKSYLFSLPRHSGQVPHTGAGIRSPGGQLQKRLISMLCGNKGETDCKKNLTGALHVIKI